MSGRRATVIMLAAWLSAAAITSGCYRMSVDPPRDSESKRALRVLKRERDPGTVSEDGSAR